MIVLDTDILTLAIAGHARVCQQIQYSRETPAISIITRIEVLRGRFESILKAAHAGELLQAQNRLAYAELEVAKYKIIAFDDAAAKTFDRLRQEKKLKKKSAARIC